jgi:ApbE superfamily uncharacterized protein (UPF0280 family)
MSGEAQVALLPDGRRLHLHHGPIDIVAQGFGDTAACRRAYRQAAARFRTILAELVGELGLLRQPIGERGLPASGAVAHRMTAAVWPHRKTFITPMAAVAGAVADEVLAAMVGDSALAKAYVDNGGDIAWHLQPRERLRAGIVTNQDLPAIDAMVELHHGMPARGMATSGWRGRSCSLGIADAVTVLAASAAQADAAATLIANAVDCNHPAITRTPANLLHDDTDLGGLLVTVAVGPLPPHAVRLALERGVARAEAMRDAGLIYAASLALQGQRGMVQPDMPWRSELMCSQHQGRTPCSIAEASWR